MSRKDDRKPGELRPLSVQVGVAPYAEGSCIIAMGDTQILCCASIEDGVPRWREESGKGWVTAEYGMLPRATHTRTARERGGAAGRTQEIQRLIGRSLRAITRMEDLGTRTIIVDCDVLQADGGTRTASVTGGCIALSLACQGLVDAGEVHSTPVGELVAGVSVGLVDGEAFLDLDFPEDSEAQVDLNVIATESGNLVEVQGTAEGDPFRRSELDEMLDLALEGIRELVVLQTGALA